MSSLRFCFVTTFYPPYNFGGDGIGVQRWARALVSRGHRVTVLCDADCFNVLSDHPAEPVTEDDGVVVERVTSGAGALSVLLTHQLGRPVLNAVPRSHETTDGDDPTHPVHDMDADQALPEDIEDESAEEGRAELTPERIENGQMGTNRRTPADDI